MIAILGVDWFWSAWLAVVAIVELLVAILGLPDLAPSWLYPVPIYVAAAGIQINKAAAGPSGARRGHGRPRRRGPTPARR